MPLQGWRQGRFCQELPGVLKFTPGRCIEKDHATHRARNQPLDILRGIARALAWTGRYSYSIYLWHLPLRVSLFKGPPTFASFFLFLATSVAFGAFMSRLIGVPVLKLRERWFPLKTILPPDVAVREHLTPAYDMMTNR